MASPEAMWSNAKVLSITNAASTDIPIAGIRDVTITPAYEHTELYTIDSTFREDVKRYEHNVNVEITYANFSLDLAKEWLGVLGCRRRRPLAAEPFLREVQRKVRVGDFDVHVVFVAFDVLSERAVDGIQFGVFVGRCNRHVTDARDRNIRV
jgi:hypothetical protein